jgi:hypothetical protein
MRIGNVGLIAMAMAVACFRDTARDAVRTDSAVARPDSATPDVIKDRSRGYLGLQHDPLPEGVKAAGGAVVTGTPSSYAFTHVRTPRGDLIWLDSIADRSGDRNRTVRAELSIPPLARDERLFMASCDVNSRLDGRVIAIVIDEPNVTKFTKIRQAWRVNERRGAFETIPIAGISCEEPGGDE